MYLGGGEWVFERLASYAKGSKYFKYDPNVTVAEVKNQVSGFAEGIKAAAMLAGEFASAGGGASAADKKDE